jgi:serine phosphatase RsbU (regulator of sigma subunit)
MTLATETTTNLAWLLPVAGPPMEAVELEASPRGMLVGRLEHCNVRLALDSVSRNHARIRFDGTRWRITDLKSRWGTFVNGVKIEPQSDVPLAEGDLIRIVPWTFRFSTKPSAKSGLLEGALESVDDGTEVSRSVPALASEHLPSLGDEMLALLLDSASAIHAAQDEKSLAGVVLDKACLGSGLPNAWLLKPAGTGGRLEVIASRPAGSSIAYSRSLINAAADGQVAELSTDRQNFDMSMSIVNLGVRSALCVPLMLGQTVAGYLYLDSRGDPTSGHRLPLRPHASAFCRALGKMAGLALANLKRIDMERRTATIEADIAAAAAAQRWILPARTGKFGSFAYTAESRQGEGLGGDFYDFVPLGDNRLAVSIGDVAGHGIAASLTMTASAGYLHAMLQQIADPAMVVQRLNQFIGPRRPIEKFVTLWVGVLDLAAGTLQYVDAGHTYALLIDPASGALRQLSGDQLCLGVEDHYEYKSLTVPLPAAGRLLLFSDGIVEQFDFPAEAEQKQFGLGGIEGVIRATPGDVDVVGALFAAVAKHAQRETLTDDATAVLVKWGHG